MYGVDPVHLSKRWGNPDKKFGQSSHQPSAWILIQFEARPWGVFIPPLGLWVVEQHKFSHLWVSFDVERKKNWKGGGRKESDLFEGFNLLQFWKVHEDETLTAFSFSLIVFISQSCKNQKNKRKKVFIWKWGQRFLKSFMTLWLMKKSFVTKCWSIPWIH